MKFTLLHLIFVVYLTKVMPCHQIPPVIIPAEGSPCPSADLQREGIQIVRNNVMSTIGNYPYYEVSLKHCGQGL